MSLNEHYKKYTRTPKPHRYMKLVGKGTPAELFWWNELFDSDYHVILDIRNEAAVAFLALKQIDAYSYNNSAFTDLYKVQEKTRLWKDIAGSWNDPTRIRRLVSSSVSSC